MSDSPPALRWYQIEAVRAAYAHLRTKTTSPCLVLPTGSGKSWVIARIALDAVHSGGRALVLAHRKELLEQNAAKLRALDPSLDVGIYSAGLGRRDADSAVVVAGIQSVYASAAALGEFQVVLVDECHLIPPDGDGMYRRFLDDSRALSLGLVVIGLTATPYRTKTGPLCGSGEILAEVCYEIGLRELIAKGFLSPLVSRAGTAVADTSGVTIRAGDFDAQELDRLMSRSDLVESAAREIRDLTRERRKVLLFASGVGHARLLQRALDALGERCGFVAGETPAAERAAVLDDFVAGDLRHLSNCDILTTGFDAPHIDCVALLRPTKSPGLYVQMVGRGLRKHPGKTNCLVLDYGANIARHGPIDEVRLAHRGVWSPGDTEDDKADDDAPRARECSRCHAIVSTWRWSCPDCGTVFQEREIRHGVEASWLPPVASGGEWHEVTGVRYSVHRKRDAADDHPRSLRVEYRGRGGLAIAEFVCVEHEGFSRFRAESWWAERATLACPKDADEALSIALDGGLREPTRILVRVGKRSKWPEIESCELGGEGVSDGHEGAAVGETIDAEVPF